MSRSAGRLRVLVNRLIVVALLLVAFAHVALTERLREGSGPSVARRWVQLGARLTGVSFERVGEVTARPAGLQVLVANHSSPLDIAAVLATHPTARFVAGADLFNIPLLAAAMRALGTVPVDRRSGSGRLIVDGESGGVLAVFAEGAIAAPGRRLPFHRGPFAMAIGAGAEVVPVAIHHSAQRLPPKSALGVRPGPVIVEYLSTIATESLDLADRYRLCDEVETAIHSALGPGDGGTGR